MVDAARPNGENLRRVLADRISSMSRFDAWPDVAESQVYTDIADRWADLPAPTELKQLPLLYVFNPNSPPEICGNQAWPLDSVSSYIDDFENQI
ncbi:unnamed protein product, partial [Mesorhabditis spiculigera]